MGSTQKLLEFFWVNRILKFIFSRLFQFSNQKPANVEDYWVVGNSYWHITFVGFYLTDNDDF